ncbi:MAG: ankyrin repeat domain-containing protein, partial [Chthoniobacteraceae bacterium]
MIHRLTLALVFTAYVVTAPAASAVTVREMTALVEEGDAAEITRQIREAGVTSDLAARFMILAAKANRGDLLERIIALGVKVDAVPAGGTNAGENALMHAAHGGHLPLVQWLIRKGAKASFVGRCAKNDCAGHSALIGAVLADSPEILKLLLDQGAPPMAVNGEAVHEAYMRGAVDLYEMLVAKGGRERPEHDSTRQQARSTMPAAAPSTASAYRFPKAAELLGRSAPSKTVRKAGSPSRVAIIADEASVAIADLLTAALQGEKGIELVERQELEKVIAEQQLTRSLAADVANAGVLGQTLRADAVVLLRKQAVNKEAILESRLVRVNPGIVLGTSVHRWEEAAPQTAVEALVPEVSSLAARSVEPTATAVSLVGVRAAVLSAGGAELERLISALLTQRLARQPGFVLLERTALDQLSAEGATGFWGGHYLASATITPAQDGSGNFALELQLQPPSGGPAIKGSGAGTRANPLQAVDQALQATLGEPAPVGHGDGDVEAKRFAEEAQFALRYFDYATAISAADCAWALGRTDRDLREIRIAARTGLLVQKHRELAPRAGIDLTQRDLFRHPLKPADFPTPAEWLSLSETSLRLWREGLATFGPAEEEEVREWYKLYQKVQANAELAFRVVHTAKERIVHRAALTSLRAEWRRTLTEAEKLAKTLPDSEEEIEIAVAELRAADDIYPVAGENLAALERLLALTFRTGNWYGRAKIRSNLPAHVGKRTFVSVITPLRQGLARSKALDDRFAWLRAQPELWRNGPKQGALQRQALETFVAMADEFAADARAFEIYVKSMDSLAQVEKALDPARPLVTFLQGGKKVYSDAYRKACLQVLTTYLEKGKSIEGSDTWLRSNAFSDEEVQALLPLAAKALARTSPAKASLARHSWHALLEKTSFGPAEMPRLAVDRYWEFHEAANVPREWAHLSLSSGAYHKGNLWLAVTHLPIRDYNLPEAYYLVRVSLPSLETEAIKIPSPVRPSTDSRIEIFFHGSRVFVARSEHEIQIYDQASRSWTINREIVPWRRAPLIDGDIAYLQLGHGLLRWNLVTGKTELLGSTRRTPAQTPLDDPSRAVTKLQIG